MASQTDWDQGGTTRQLRKIYLGPSMGWLHFPGNQILAVTQAGTYNVALGVTLIEVSVAGSVTINLPSTITTPAGGQAIPGQFVGAPITVVDVGGNAANFPITIIPFGSETIAGLSAAQITTAYGAATVTPNFPSSSWTLTSAASTRVRQILQADTNYFVNTSTGSDSNDGLSSGAAFKTIQKGINTATGLDFNGHYVAINVAAGTYNEDLTIGGPPNNSGLVGAPDLGLAIVGDLTTPSNVTINSTSNCLTARGPTIQIAVSGFKFTSSGGSGIFAADGASVDMRICEFGSCASGYHMLGVRGNVGWQGTGNSIISGGAIAHIGCFETSMGGSAAHTVTITGTPTFSDAFVVCENGTVDIENITFVNGAAAIGKRFRVDYRGSIVPTSGSSLTYLPGNAAGIIDDGSVYNFFRDITSRNLGTISSGTITALDMSNTVSPLVRVWYYTNNGAHTLPAPTMDGTLRVLITNGASAGAITFTGFTTKAAPGDALNTTNGNKFLIEIFTINAISTYRVYALQ